jgi:hypothetical protein
VAIAPVEGDKQSAAVQSLSLLLERETSPISIVIAGAFIAVAAGVLLVPFSLLAARAAEDPASFIATIRQPAIALQLGLALVVAVAFVAVPLRKLVRRSLQPRRIVISGGHVVASHDSAGTPAWSEPLTAYRGVAHHIRTSLSGAQHEIVLVHPDASKSIVLQSADRIAQPQVDAMACLLNVAEVPARAIYQTRRSRTWNQQPAALEAA